jgi:hypothetical protein
MLTVGLADPSVVVSRLWKQSTNLIRPTDSNPQIASGRMIKIPHHSGQPDRKASTIFNRRATLENDVASAVPMESLIFLK